MVILLIRFFLDVDYDEQSHPEITARHPVVFKIYSGTDIDQRPKKILGCQKEVLHQEF